jgi:hypothetical protein
MLAQRSGAQATRLPSRNERPVIHELHEVAPAMIPVLECMVLDGVEERGNVAEYVHAVVGYISV